LKKLSYSIFTLVYFLLCLIVILADYFDLKWTYYLSKPIVLILVFIFFKTRTSGVTGKMFKNLILAGFAFSCLGDTLLMFTEESELYFMGGLVAFLIAHVFYTSGFIKDMFDKRPWNQHWGQLAFATLMVVYGAEFFILNRISFGDFYLPVLIYCVAISMMGVSAVMRDKYKNPAGFYKVVAGALFFMISDSLLATNKFITPFDYSGPLILGTYFLAQYLIAVGCLVDMKKPVIL